MMNLLKVLVVHERFVALINGMRSKQLSGERKEGGRHGSRRVRLGSAREQRDVSFVCFICRVQVRIEFSSYIYHGVISNRWMPMDYCIPPLGHSRLSSDDDCRDDQSETRGSKRPMAKTTTNQRD